MRRTNLPAARPNAAVTVDCVVFGVDMAAMPEECLKVLLVERANDPFKGRLALPGGFVEEGEGLADAALRELREATGLGDVYLEQLYTFGDPGRDPRGRVVSVAYYALTSAPAHVVKAGSDAARAHWSIPPAAGRLAFDHARILEVALERLRGKIRYAPVGFRLLSDKFSFGDLQRLYEEILGRPIDKRNFARRIMGLGLVTYAGVSAGREGHRRGTTLYRFNEHAYRRAQRDGLDRLA